MPEWEYCHVAWKVRQISDAQERELEEQGFEGLIETEEETTVARLGYLNFLGCAEKPQAIVELENTIAQLGRDGWELVSHTQITSPTAVQVFYFKRQGQRV